MDASARTAPPPLLLAASLAGVEAALLGVMAVVEMVSFDSARAAMGVTTTVFFLGYAAVLAWCARHLARLDSWARSPVVLAQLIQLGVAWSFRGQGTLWVALGLAAMAIAVLVGVFHPASIEAMAEPDQE